MVAILALVGVTTGALAGHSIDQRIVTAAHRLVLHHALVLDLARHVTHLGTPVLVDIVAAVATIGLCLWGRIREAGFVAGVRVSAVIVESVLKSAVHRTRPVLVHPVAHAQGFSFPSGHALGAASVYLPVALALLAHQQASIRRAGLLVAVAICLLVATSRVLLGVHYPSDVIAGLALGGALASGGWALVVISRGSRGYRRRSAPRRRTPRRRERFRQVRPYSP
ncbi:MAG TPA: phosphatase PAP2 family protein [Mycobacteriales bacterium]|nr:phosphatase PAP2 family protein [Mycobacteriales bacterium]